MISLKKIKTSNKFLLIMILIYFLVGFFNFDLAKEGILNTFNIFIKIIPILVLLVVINFVINKYFKAEKIVRYLGKESGFKGWLLAIISGILISGPPYLLFPLLKDLKSKGMSNSLIAVFLYNRNVKIPFLPVMIYYFGLAFTVIISFYIIVFSVLNGLLINLFIKEKSGTNTASN